MIDFGVQEAVTLPYYLTMDIKGVLRHQTVEILLYFLGFQMGFLIFFVATVGGSIEFGAFDKIARSIELHVRSIRFQAHR